MTNSTQDVPRARAFYTGLGFAAEDHRAMYAHSFLDPDGHGWNLIHVAETS